jgi:hypothetical protein
MNESVPCWRSCLHVRFREAEWFQYKAGAAGSRLALAVPVPVQCRNQVQLYDNIAGSIDGANAR